MDEDFATAIQKREEIKAKAKVSSKKKIIIGSIITFLILAAAAAAYVILFVIPDSEEEPPIVQEEIPLEKPVIKPHPFQLSGNKCKRGFEVTKKTRP